MNTTKINKLFSEDLIVINMGLDVFAENLRKEGIRTLQMNWRPPAGGEDRLVELLERLHR